MKNITLSMLLVMLFGSSYAQKSAIIAALAKHNIDENVMDPKLKQRPDNYAFDLKYSSITEEKEKISLATFDPSKKEGEKWTLLSVNGNPPTDADVKTFRKEHSKPAQTQNKIDDNSWKVEKEDPDYLVVSYKPDAASLPAEASFLKDCRIYMTMNLKTKKLEKLESINEKPIKIKIINAKKMNLLIRYDYNEQEKIYIPISEDLNLLVSFLGQLVNIQTLSEYSNYRKI